MITTGRKTAALGLDTPPHRQSYQLPPPHTPIPLCLVWPLLAPHPAVEKYLLPRPPGCLGQAPQGDR